MEALKTLAEEMVRLNNEIEEKSKGLFDFARKTFFEAHPNVYAIAWNQYSPYFNDGEACNFSVNEMQLYLTEDDFEDDPRAWEGSNIPSASDYADAIGIVYHGKPIVSSWRNKTYYENIIAEVKRLEETHPDLPQILIDFDIVTTALAQIPESLYEATFDNHVVVVMTKDGIEAEEFDHD